ncbi:MAG: glycosyltransferase [Desulfuromonadaceae bacterium]
MGKEFGFVVLNYMNYSDTIECVTSVLEINRTDYVIVIVDNCSPNDSLKELQQYFSSNQKVHIVSSPGNLGYSGGNNLGIRWLRDRYIDKIIIATNDTVLISKDILDKFDALDLENVGIVGPSILSLDGTLQNPTLIAPNFLYFANLFFYKPMKHIRTALYRRFPGIEQLRINTVDNCKSSMLKENAATAVPQPKKVYMLHGSFFYLTKSFIDRIGMLDDNIFMYGEEDLLSWQCEQYDLARLFMPSISVLHKERKSTESVHKSEKSNFIELNTIKSRKYLTGKIRLIPFLFFLIKRRVGM